VKVLGSITAAATALLLALCASAAAQQPKKIPRVGYLQAPPAAAVATRTDAFRQGLRELGYFEGKNIVVDWRFGEGIPKRVPEIGRASCRERV